jgi:hypothetical protein
MTQADTKADTPVYKSRDKSNAVVQNGADVNRILKPGTFRVSDYRKPIPNKVKLAVMARDYDADHDPALAFRPFDTEAGDFIPPQHSAEHLVLRRKDEHREKTFGRKRGAERTVTTAGSDIGNVRHGKDIQESEAIHQARIASKNGKYEQAADILSSVRRKKKLKPRAKIPSRPFATKRTVRRAAECRR